MRFLILSGIAACGLFVVAAASSDEPRATDATVKGVITLSGKPLASARVFFHLKDGQFIGCRLKDDGKYAIDRMPTGEYTVTVEGEHVPKKYSEERIASLKVQVSDGKNLLDFQLQ